MSNLTFQSWNFGFLCLIYYHVSDNIIGLIGATGCFIFGFVGFIIELREEKQTKNEPKKTKSTRKNK